MPCQSRLWKRGQAIGLCSLLRVSSEYCHASDPPPVAKVRLEPPISESHAAEGDCRRRRTILRKSFSSSSGSREYPSAAAQRTSCCSRNLASRSCASHSTFVPRHLPKGPACLRCVAHAAAVGRELKGMSYRLRFGPQGWESMARAADHGVLKSRWSHASEIRCACSV